MAGYKGLWNFFVADTRRWTDNHVLRSIDLHTRWNIFIPRKVNIFVWRVLLDRLPSSDNLDKRGINIPYTLCHVCSIEIEQLDHFFICEVAARTWNAMFFCLSFIQKMLLQRAMFDAFVTILVICKKMNHWCGDMYYPLLMTILVLCKKRNHWCGDMYYPLVFVAILKRSTFCK